MSFLKILEMMEAKNDDKFEDQEGREWTFITDGTASAISCSLDGGKTKLKLTQEQLSICSAPVGFQKKMSDKQKASLVFGNLLKQVEEAFAKVESMLED